MTRGARYPGSDPFKYHYNRAAYFNKMNRNKYGITLDLNQDEGKKLFLDLIAESDVLIENNSPRVMRNFGLEYDTLRQVNPDLIMVSISGFGQTGPERDYIAYGANIEASCGLADATGYPDDDRPYKTTLFYADPVTAMHAAVATLAALHKREEGGSGQYIDMSLHENGITFFPEALLEYALTGKLATKTGNRHPRYAPQGCYPSIGDDAWMVLTVRNDEEWVRMTRAMGRYDLAEDDKYSTAEQRRIYHDEIDEAISEWTALYDHNEATRILQDAGIAAGPVLANWEMVSNLHFHERGFYVPVPHAEMGVFPYPGMPWILSETPGAIRMGAPNFGEHNRLIFDEFLNLSESKLAELYDKRVIADSPPDDLPGPIRLPR
jgi:crotonobetainyl-CoA:carnitine CoA-transferase CaiB-like acyl-CoA transferase